MMTLASPGLCLRRKPGRKIWIWGLSREGMIWENLLRDTDGRCVEIQSGLLNRTAENSSLTPFKHREFAPYASDVWTGYLTALKGIKGFVTASPSGAVEQSPARMAGWSLAYPAAALGSPGQRDRVLMQKVLSSIPCSPSRKMLRSAVCPSGSGHRRQRHKLPTYPPTMCLSRLWQRPRKFRLAVALCLYLKGKEKARQQPLTLKPAKAFREPPHGRSELSSGAQCNGGPGQPPHRLPGRPRLRPQGAEHVDTYDPEANYQFGQSSAGLGLTADAEDTFSRCHTFSGLAKPRLHRAGQGLCLREKRYARALACAGESLDSNVRNLDPSLSCRAIFPQAAASLQATCRLRTRSTTERLLRTIYSTGVV